MSEDTPIQIMDGADVVGHGNIIQLVEAEGNSTVRDVVQQVFVDGYERLRDACIHPWSVFERADLDHFVCREWLLAEADVFLRDHDPQKLLHRYHLCAGARSLVAHPRRTPRRRGR